MPPGHTSPHARSRSFRSRGKELAIPPEAALKGVGMRVHEAGQQGHAREPSRRGAAQRPSRFDPAVLPMAICTPDAKSSPIQVRSASMTSTVMPACSAVRSCGRHLARAPEFGGREKTIRPVGYFDTARSKENAFETHPAKPSRIGREHHALGARLVQFGAQLPVDRRTFRHSHGGAFTDVVERQRSIVRRRRCHLADALDHLLGDHPRQEPDAELHLTPVGNDVGRAPAGNRADVECRKRHFGEVLPVGGPLLLHLPPKAGRVPR